MLYHYFLWNSFSQPLLHTFASARLNTKRRVLPPVTLIYSLLDLQIGIQKGLGAA